MKKAISLSFFYIYFLTLGFGQQTTDLRQVFLSAESFFLFEEFDEALPLYMRLHKIYPENYNLYFKIGVCYLNSPYEKNKSIFYLEVAAENINLKYKEGNIKELGAPLDALFFLGNAYRVNNDLEKARNSYKKFQAQMDPVVYDNNLVIDQLNVCDVAEKLMKTPVDIDVEILSNQINTRFADNNSVVSGDETKMVYISKLQFYDAVFYTERKNGAWTMPRNITSELGVDGDVYPTCLSYDGTLLILYRNDNYIGNLYSSSLVNGVWSPLLKLNENINTKYWESHGSLTKDGNTLYFTSNRKGGYGGLDIYKSTKIKTGDWGPPVNLGPAINSKYNEESPFITENERKLFFSSYGHYNMGGYDIFMSVMNSDNSWAIPVNIGYPVNSTDDDVFFCPINDGEIAYYPVYKETGYGKYDIYRYQFYTADHPRKYNISGTINYSGESVIGSEVYIIVINQSNGDTTSIVHPDDAGFFKFSLPAGNYSLIFDHEKFENGIKSLTVSPDTPHSGISLSEQVILTPLTDKLLLNEPYHKLQIEDSIQNVKNGNPIPKTFTSGYSNDCDLNNFLTPGQFKNKNEKPEEIVAKVIPENNFSNITSDYRIDDTLNQFLVMLIDSAGGKEKEFLQKVDLNKYGITSVEGLIQYLINNNAQNSTTQNYVFQLIDKVLGSRNLKDLIANVREIAPTNISRSIVELNIDQAGFGSIEDLMKYMAIHSKEYGYTIEDVWNVILHLAISGEVKTLDDLPEDNKQGKHSVASGVAFTLGIFGVLGIITFILILIERKKGKSKE